MALPIEIPMTDIFEVGTGGGSIARLGQGNALRIGPQSAGSMPGPVCYGRGGTKPTVTDANLILGRLGILPLVALFSLGATSALEVLLLTGLAYAFVPTITFSLYLYSAELYPTRLRAIGTGLGSAWLQLGASAWLIAQRHRR